MAKNHGVPPLGPGAQDEVDNVPQEMVGGDVGRPHGGVVAGAAPILAAAQLQLSMLVDLANGEGEGREAVARRRLPKHPHARDRGQGNRRHRPVVGGGARADDPTQPGLRHQLVEERLRVLLVPGPGGFPRHIERVLPPEPVEPLRVGVALVGAGSPPGRGADRPQHVKADVHVLLEVVCRRVTHAPEQAIEHEALKGPGPVLSDVSGAHMHRQGRQPRSGVVLSVLDQLPEFAKDVLADAIEIVAPLPAKL